VENGHDNEGLLICRVGDEKISHRMKTKGPQGFGLIDEGLPAGLKETLTALGHECQTMRKAGFGSKKNGELLTPAEDQWDVLLTNNRISNTGRP
jgi:hypothetical protein